MNKQDYLHFEKLITSACQKMDVGKMNTATVQLMFTSLMCYKLDQVQDAIIKHIKTSPYAPKVNDIVSHIEGSAHDYAQISFGWIAKIARECALTDNVRLPCKIAMKTIIDLGGIERLKALSDKDMTFFYTQYTQYYQAIYKHRDKFDLPSVIEGKPHYTDKLLPKQTAVMDINGRLEIENKREPIKLVTRQKSYAADFERLLEENKKLLAASGGQQNLVNIKSTYKTIGGD